MDHTEQLARVQKALAKINDIRNSIIGTQTANWSAHIYPLVAALEEAGIKGQGYEVAKAKAKTLIEQHDTAINQLFDVSQERDKLQIELAELRAASIRKVKRLLDINDK